MDPDGHSDFWTRSYLPTADDAPAPIFCLPRLNQTGHNLSRWRESPGIRVTWPDRPAQVPRSEGRDPAVQCGWAAYDQADWLFTIIGIRPTARRAARKRYGWPQPRPRLRRTSPRAWVIGPPPASTSGSDSPPVVFSRVAAWLARHPCRAFRARSLIQSISSARWKTRRWVPPDPEP